MCLQRSPSVARWPSGKRRARPSAAGNARVLDAAIDDIRVPCIEHGRCVLNRSRSPSPSRSVPATTAPRARTLAAACLILAALTIAARCYASPHPALPRLHPSLTKRAAATSPPATSTSSLSSTIAARNFTNTNENATFEDVEVTAVNRARVREFKAARVSERISATSTPRPMPPVLLHEQPADTVSGDAEHQQDIVDRSGGTAGGSGGGLLALVVSATLLTATLGLITCVVSHYRGGGSTAGSSPPPPQHHPAPATDTDTATATGNRHYITAPMLSVMSASAAAGVGVAAAAAGGIDGGGGVGGGVHRHVNMSRELATERDRQVRLHSVRTDLELNLPHNIALPDGEEYGSSARLHIRDPEQESEIYQKCIRAPPNRTVFDIELPPPYRSSSAGLLGSLGSSSSSGTSDWSTGSTPLVVRCHSMSSTSTGSGAGAHKPHGHSSQKTDFLQRTVKIFTGRKSSQQPAASAPSPAPTLPVVIVPVRPRRLEPTPPRSDHV